MSICLCNLSADVALEFLAQEGRELEPAELDLSSVTASAPEVASALGEFATHLPRPIELLVGNAKQRRSSNETVCHVWHRPLPRGSVLRVHRGAYVTAPEFTLLQQSCQINQANLCQLLGRYLGTWTPRHEGQVERAPLTTLEQLNAYVKGVGKARGLHNLKLAMAYTCEGAASAPETSLQLVTSLPPELCGLNLPLPTMNYKVDLSACGRSICGKEHIRIDLCWPEKRFGLEYQGPEHKETLGADYARFYAARDAGYELWYVAKDQLANSAQMDYIGREVAQRLGIRVDEKLWPDQAQLQDLLDTLAGKLHPKPVGFEELKRRRAAMNSRPRVSPVMSRR